ncbi:DUF6778 family protein [Sulfitobacter donghicola]|uniref:Lipoprotein n=1 Tax=Sulfitobacter donghicola DSW-25 = KCTC 12864 = JCM 14565 TaxID=1300350 RepID=A0A073IEL9_9RHOB|nr:DUF6778 family protein [Sulfitobacter donghicola]KEJ87931.1 hypothetical protein DSW25_04260 [Sulfitobacter donghicola DSW-25 = KCTC 12864 = JCM 14565]KIN66489.1 Lipoprotein [Sulfitobacter donghicola DSW-25 = KCTC 12864 = JCM 14565]
MKMIKLACALSIGAALSACGGADIVSRDAPFSEQQPPRATYSQTDVSIVSESNVRRTVRTVSEQKQAPRTILPAAILRQINVAKVNVSVPTSLKVSEANRYYPNGDIVWREDPIGNRHAQVSKIVHDAMTAGVSTFQGPVPVLLDIEVVRFHALSEKARYTVGGDHHIVFKMVLRDAATGEFLSEPRQITTDLEAFGGQQAISAEARGLTQKVRISGHLAEVIRQEMTEPAGYKNASFGFYQLVNRI